MDCTPEDIYKLLESIKDPEIPVLSLVDLGIIKNVVIADDQVRVTITPTFVGCPALDTMRSEIETTLLEKGIGHVSVEVSFREPWTSDSLSEKGRIALKKYGLAPPPQDVLITDLDILENAECPRCSGRNTELRSAFGSTLCRSIHYCRDCRESFEQFKPL